MVNKVILIGRLGKDPEQKSTPSGVVVTTLVLATNEKWTDKQGQKQEATEWHRVICWGKLAEICGQYLHKGSEVFVEGKIETRSWEDKQGQKRYSTEIKASAVKFLGSKSQEQAPAQQAPIQQPMQPQVPQPSFTEDQIPF